MKNSRKKTTWILLLSAMLFSYCKKEETVNPATTSDEVPLLPSTPDDYTASGNDNLATLGRVLFYDKLLSKNNNISCGSCHKQENAFTDNLQFSPGTDNLTTDRNTPSIFAKNGRLFWDGRSHSLQDLTLMPVRNKVEMNIDNIQALVERLGKLDYYNFLFKRAFSHSRIDSHAIKLALAEFLKNFNFSNNKFHLSEKGLATLSPSEQLGKDLFFGRAQCSNCHHIIGNNIGGGSSNGGYGHTNESHNIGLDAQYTDEGVARITKNHAEIGAFMMPVLLNIEHTAPYMHDGRFKTLEEVVEHYNSEVKDHPALDPILRDFTTGKPRQLNLNDYEKTCLVDFLKTLTDPAIFTDKKFSNPFIARIK
jgi:cytochrome c peroxidase